MVIPVGDLNPVRRTPWVTRLLLLGTIGAFFFWQPFGAGGCEQYQFFLRWAAVPAELTHAAPLDAGQVAQAATGPLAGCDLQPVPDKPVYLTVLTSLLLHADIWHLGFNMLFLWIFGNNIEDRFGRVRFLGLYALWGIVATVVFVAANPDTPVVLVGASGAIAGVLGAYLVLYPTARVTVLVLPLFFLTVQLPALVVLGMWFALELLRSLETETVAGGGVAYLAHVAGFVAGSVTAVVARIRGRRRQPRRRRRR